MTPRSAFGILNRGSPLQAVDDPRDRGWAREGPRPEGADHMRLACFIVIIESAMISRPGVR
jgi:hypothetical protein